VLVVDEVLVVVDVEVVLVACDVDAGVVVLPEFVVPEVTNDAIGGPGKS
jgi:hypothetical protein